MDLSQPAQDQMDRIDRQIQEAHKRAEQTQAFAQEVDKIRVQATSPRDELTVTVDSLGRLEHLTLTSRALDLGADGLAAAIIEAAGDARRQAGEKVISMGSDLFGAESQTVAMLRETYLPEPAASDDADEASPFGFGR